MYQKAYGIIKTFAPLHVGATAGEERGNLNLIFRDQFTQTGIVPGSSIRGRLRAEMRQYLGGELGSIESNKWYGTEASSSLSDRTTEALVKFEYASIVWLPVFCPGQPIVWVSCPRLLKRYQRIAGSLVKHGTSLLKDVVVPKAYTRSTTLEPLKIRENGKDKEKLFFNFGFVTIEKNIDLSAWFPNGEELPAVVVADDEIARIHDMALYRQSRVALEKDQKRVADKAFFNVEALPEDTILVFPVALKKDEYQKQWQPFSNVQKTDDIYLGGLESVGFGHCEMQFFNIEVSY